MERITGIQFNAKFYIEENKFKSEKAKLAQNSVRIGSGVL